jgi:hypothetical protein
VEVQFAGQLLLASKTPECQAIHGILGQITEVQARMFSMQVKIPAHNPQSISDVSCGATGAPARPRLIMPSD